MEVWGQIEGYEGLYDVSDKGRVRSWARGTPKILKPSATGRGYLRVELWIGGKLKRPKIHRLVMLAFIPNPKHKRTVNHKNGIKTDNRLENLEWATHSENNLHSYRELGRKALCGRDNHRSKEVVQRTLAGEEVARFGSTGMAERDGFLSRRVSDCCLGKRKTHCGYRWEYT